MKKDLLKIMDLRREEFLEILDLAVKIKADLKNGVRPKYLKNKTLGMIFEKNSTRTRVSFEVGMLQLGGSPLFLSGSELQMGRGEPVEDTARVLSRFLDGIMIRTFEQSMIEKLAEYSTIPIINGLTDFSHPCQILADFLTIREYKGGFDGLKLCFVGDGNNMANSIIAASALLGLDISVACPEGYEPDRKVIDFAAGRCALNITSDLRAAAEKADVVFTDVWASMGQEQEAVKRRADFAGFCVDEELLSVAAPDCMVQHCLPAHRGEEISAQTFEKHAGEIFDEAENRLHAQKAVLVKLMS